MRSPFVYPSSGQNTLSRLVNSVRFDDDTVGADFRDSAGSAGLRETSDGIDSSNLHSSGSMSSRNPIKTGARSFLSDVHSPNLTSQTSLGTTHVDFRSSGGSALKGRVFEARAASFLCASARARSSKPPPTLPT